MHSTLLPVVAWLVGLLTAGAPPGRPQYEPAAKETVEQAQERYQGIAEAIATVAYDAAEEPVEGNRRFTAALMAAVAYHESGFRRDVDLGIGRARLAASGWNDSGRSWCLMQINLGRKDLDKETADRLSAEKGFAVTMDSALKTREGWTGLELLQDREKCFRAGLHVLKGAVGVCHHLGRLDWLRSYASGNCSDGANESALRMGTAIRWGRSAKNNWNDAEIMRSLNVESQVVLGFVVAE